ncbi:MAG: hypothetical protein JNJ86_09475 [Chitinophagaceae bacterium]|jgi:hypothetical protein|nr:hypothetical protein [Chitinophagaceae bacterium]
MERKKSLPLYCLLVSCLAGLLLSLSGCDNDPQKVTAAEDPYPDKGDFRLLYHLIRKNSPAKDVIAELRTNRIADEVVKELNQLFKLPHDVPIYFKEAVDTTNAWYDPDSRKITFSTSMVDVIYTIFAEVYEGDELRAKAMNAVIFILFHEIGHALIDMYDLSVTGSEEDVVDNFSIFLLTTGNELAEAAAIDGANFFNVLARAEEGMPVGLLPLWDEHSLSKERFFNIITKVYGKDPQRYEYFVTKGLFPAEKTQRYVQDYQKVMQSWKRDLDPYLKK